MSIVSQRRRGPRVNRRIPMGGVLDFITPFIPGGSGIQSAVERVVGSECIQVAESKMGGIDAQVADVEQNWNPTGYYTADQMGQILAFAYKLTEPAAQAISKAINQLNLPDHVDRLMSALNDVQGAVGVGGNQNSQMAEFEMMVARGRTGEFDVIHAPGLKRFVVDVLKASRRATRDLYAVECERPSSMLSALAAIDNARSAFIGVVKSIIGAIVDIGSKIADLPDTIGSMITIAKWSVLAGAVYFLAAKAGLVPPKYDFFRE